jgi:hypothetical protein
MKCFLPLSTTLLMAATMWAQSAQVQSAQVQSAQVPIDFEQLAKKAEQVTRISLDKDAIQMAMWLIPKNGDTAKLRKVIENLQGIYVRSYTFDKDGDFSSSDLDPLRRIITGSGWSCLVSVHKKKTGEDTDLCLRKDKDRILGLAIINAEPKELTVVNILGAITPEEFSQLQEFFDIPTINIEKPQARDKPKDPKDKPDKGKPDQD